MPTTKNGTKVAGFRFDGGKKSFQTASVNKYFADGVKQGGDWFNAEQPYIARLSGSKSRSRLKASAMIAKIPLPLSRHIAATYR